MATRRGRKRKDETRVPPILLRSDIDAMAKRRCLMLLSVLSGQQSVSQAIADAQIAAGTYYQLESRALLAMLSALTPDSTSDGAPSTWKQLSRLESKVKKLEQDKRRLERLLALTKKVVRRGPMTQSRTSKRSPRSPTTTTTPTCTATSSTSGTMTMDSATKQDQASRPISGGAAGR